MAHRPLRSYASFLVALGWIHVVGFTLAGFAPWFVLAGRPIPADSPWEQWAFYAAPAVGLLAGTLAGLGCFVLSGVIRVLLDQRDLLEEQVQASRRLLQVMESRQTGDRAAAADPFDLSDIKDADEPLL